ncbi:hypothetical protein [Streptomyces sp. NPDC005438]|uniref:hypothetical protein n=1 Tax=Streptomyces sp. NPDC005438 TaxID=3156880 RepID=UPI0033B0E7C1
MPDNDAYRLVDVHASLQLNSQAKTFIARQQADGQRISRLRFLKENLYDHPDLVVVDRLEHRSPGDLDEDYVAELQRLSRLIKSCDQWWSPLLRQWEEVGKGFNDPEQQQRAMLALIDALNRLDKSIDPDLSGLPQNSFTEGQERL